MLSNEASDKYYVSAVKVREKIRAEFTKVFKDEKVDVLVTPTTPGGPFSLNTPADPVELFMTDVMTSPASLAGLPALSVPIDLTDKNPNKGLPLGLQIIGSYGNENSILRVAKELETLSGFREKIPNRVFGR